jgi:iron complex transport system substrate-binding protein
VSRRRLVVGALAATTLLAACGSDGASTAAPDGSDGDRVDQQASEATAMPADTSETTTPAATAPAAPTASPDGSDGEPDDAERRIVPLDGDIAEIVFALGAGDDVVAVDLSATYPPEAAALPKFGFVRALGTEPILAFEPTVVIGTDAAGPPETIDELRRVDVPVTIIERDMSAAGPSAKIRAVGAALGLDDVAGDLATSVQEQIDAATVDAAAYDAPMKVLALYLRGENLQFVLGEGSGIDWLIDAAGAVDVADELGVVETAPITAEAILAEAPDAIVVPASGLESAGGLDALLALPGIAGTPAAEHDAILAYDDQLMLGNGPRTGEFLATLVADLQAIDDRRPTNG